MRTLVIDNPASRMHRVPPGHPEHEGRYLAARDALTALTGPVWHEARPAETASVERFHTADYIERIRDACDTAAADEWVSLDLDTKVCRDTWRAALATAGASIDAVDRIMAGEADAAFCLARPPGHHAEPDRAMGFCLLNSIAIAALHALEVHGLARVAIVDIDVHHGNGSQCLAELDTRVMFASLHQSPLYPGTGSADETGLNGNVVNVPLMAGTQGPAWRDAFTRQVRPALAAFRPEFIFVSAGFDAHERDPAGGLALLEADFAWAASQLAGLAAEFASSRLVSVLEGGYDCPALGRSAAAFVQALVEA
ncbi:histone deacetylase family protein [uncultured Maricaulis sp.]|uniref:histone deacetylase family protein n=1 Tax=uncultured Maricaulis sp. TaxID=174710 RepID=UPI0030D78538|tara:strand:+ start:50403 stop:51335 length:933 start_codon:yes stop_codon:yes gene_type:complete